MRIIGIDPSLTSLGWAYLDTETEYSASGALKSRHKGLERLVDLRAQVKKILVGLPLDRAVIEGYAFSANRGHDQGEIGGVVRLACYDAGLPIDVVPPATLKKWTTGKGNAKKDFMLLKCFRRWGVEFETVDEADAFALAQWGAEQHGGNHADIR